jgi:hypothetical protein
MNKYNIVQQIVTSVRLSDPIKIQDYSFTYDWENRILIATRVVVANRLSQALAIFGQELSPILESMSILTQCMVDPLGFGSFVAVKEGFDAAFFGYHGEKTPAVGMFFDNDNLPDLEKIKEINNPTAFSYLQEAISAYAPHHGLSMLLNAAEAFAGYDVKGQTCENCGSESSNKVNVTRKAELRRILGRKLYGQLYCGDNPARHAISHGRELSKVEASSLSQEVYNRLFQKYLKESLGLSSIKSIKGAPRAFSYQYTLSFFKFKNPKGEIELTDFISNYDSFVCVGSIADF